MIRALEGTKDTDPAELPEVDINKEMFGKDPSPKVTERGVKSEFWHSNDDNCEDEKDRDRDSDSDDDQE